MTEKKPEEQRLLLLPKQLDEILKEKRITISMVVPKGLKEGDKVRLCPVGSGHSATNGNCCLGEITFLAWRNLMLNTAKIGIKICN